MEHTLTAHADGVVQGVEGLHVGTQVEDGQELLLRLRVERGVAGSSCCAVVTAAAGEKPAAAAADVSLEGGVAAAVPQGSCCVITAAAAVAVGM